jgi:two-component system, OmpR family, sensor histidine kinase ChvG
MSAHAKSERAISQPGAKLRYARVRTRMRLVWRAVVARFSSSLTRRIVVLNLGGLLVLVIGFLLLNQFRADIIAARVQSLRTQAEIIAAAVAASATVETDAIQIDPEKLLQLAPGDTAAPPPTEDDSIEFSINPERVGPVLHRLVTPTHTRARIYDRDGLLLIDSQTLSARGIVQRPDSAEVTASEATFFRRLWNFARGRWLAAPQLPANDDPWVTNGNAHPEVAAALAGKIQSEVRPNVYGETIVSVGVPIQRLTTVRGALLLSTQGGDIDKVIASERWALLRFFLVLAAVMLVLSISLAGTIAEPVRKLAEAAERVRRGIKSRQQIPDFTNRSDEIGHLSHALRDMTKALYQRIDAIESFAADVAHELKNPLTSLRSAVEILPKVSGGASRDRLLEVIQHDVRRLDRLISDISDASRLDAELARNDAGPVDLIALLEAVVSAAKDSPRRNGVTVRLDSDKSGSSRGKDRYVVLGHDSRLAQVFTNLIDNACSFSRPGDEVRISVRRETGVSGELDQNRPQIVVTIDDDGPGVPPHALERIFERFYTDRPNHGFGQNSGLGLSISRQIVEAHGGRIWAENRAAPPGAPRQDADSDEAEGDDERHFAGARFVLTLPAA